MNKILLCIVTIFTLCFICGCSAQESTAVEGSEAPARYESEEAFVKAVKTASETDIYDLNEIAYYYRPKNLPEGATLMYIQVRDTYVMFVYTLDTDKNSTDTTKTINYMWYRSFDGGRTHPDPQGFIDDMSVRRGYKIVNLEGQGRDATYMVEQSLEEAKAAIETIPTWCLFYTQGGECFRGDIPFSIPERDIAKYLEMEKVVIE